jgi:predicted RNA-binding protein with EMAP domain
VPAITLFIAENIKPKFQIIKEINENGRGEKEWFSAVLNKSQPEEIIVSYFFEESIEEHLSRVLEEDEIEEVISVLKQNGNSKVIKKITSFFNVNNKLLEIYRGPDKITERIVEKLTEITGIQFKRIKVSSNGLQQIYQRHSLEVTQAIFKNIDGLFYQIMRGSNLETNKRFLEYMTKFKDCLRVISIRPAIKFLNGGKYQVTVNGDKGSIRFSPLPDFGWRPRFEIRQVVDIVRKYASV